MATPAEKIPQQRANPLQKQDDNASGKAMPPPTFALEASTTQLKAEGQGTELAPTGPVQLKKKGTAAATQPAAEEGKDLPPPTLKDKLDAIDATKDAKTRQAKAVELMTFVREQEALYPPKIKAFKAQATPETTEKVAVIGRLAALAARVEWLLGTIYVQGSKDESKWEDKKTNDDKQHVLSGYYQAQTASAKDLGPWCTKFIGTVYRNVAGLQTKEGKKPNGELWSGYKVGRGDYFDYDTAHGGVHVGHGDNHEKGKDNSVWINYRKSLEKEKDAEKRKVLADTFLTDKIAPQAGDAMIVKRPKAASNSYLEGKSHSTMIERRDGYKLYTIEGNSGDRVQAKVYDLTDADDVAKIIFISRFGIESYGDKPKKEAAPKKGEAAKPVVEAPVAEVAAVSETDLLAPMNELLTKLQDYATEKGFINALAEGKVDTIYNRQQSSAGNDVE